MNPNQEFAKLASEESIRKVARALEENGMEVEVLENKVEALERLKASIPEGSEVMTGSSITLDQIGFTDLLTSGKHPWKNLKEAIVNEKDQAKQMELRKKSVLSDYFLGSVQAITEDGQVLIASNSGSQLPAYAFTSPHVIWVAGTQKIVADFDTALRRIQEYCLLLENERAQKAYGMKSNVSKVLIINKEIMPGRIKILLVKERLGF
jgi:L-lactate utilization protein LutB